MGRKLEYLSVDGAAYPELSMILRIFSEAGHSFTGNGLHYFRDRVFWRMGKLSWL